MGRNQKSKDNNNDEDIDRILNSALSGSAYEVNDRYGSAMKEHLFAYSGVDYENNIKLKKSLESISKGKINSDYEKSNLRQQAGYAAENKYAARENAKHIIDKDGIRIHHTDTSTSGSFNELFDHLVVKDGKVISSEQMKFVKNDPGECVDLLLSKKYDKYFDNNATFTLPKDYFDLDSNGQPKIYNELDKKIDTLEKQINSKKLDPDTLAKKKDLLNKCKKLRNGGAKNSNISFEDALEARLHPKWSTVKDIAKVAHKAGCEQAVNGAIIGGSISAAMNVVALIKGDKSFSEASKDVVKTTAAAAATSYLTAFVGATIKGSMQNSASAAVRSAAKTNLPAAMVTAAIETSKTLKGYLCGKYSGKECASMLVECGTNMIGSAVFGVVGQILIPIPIVGSMVGSMVGCVITSVSFGLLKSAMQEAAIERERRIQIERMCEEHIKILKKYRKDMDMYFKNYLIDMKSSFEDALTQIHDSFISSDSDEFVTGCNKITSKLGGKVNFSNKKEFDSLMNSKAAIEF